MPRSPTSRAAPQAQREAISQDRQQDRAGSESAPGLLHMWTGGKFDPLHPQIHPGEENAHVFLRLSSLALVHDSLPLLRLHPAFLDLIYFSFFNLKKLKSTAYYLEHLGDVQKLEWHVGDIAEPDRGGGHMTPPIFLHHGLGDGCSWWSLLSPMRQAFVAGTTKAQRFGGTCCQGAGIWDIPEGQGGTMASASLQYGCSQNSGPDASYTRAWPAFPPTGGVRPCASCPRHTPAG